MKYIIGAGAAIAVTGLVAVVVLVDALLDYSQGVYDWAEVSNGRPLRPAPDANVVDVWGNEWWVD